MLHARIRFCAIALAAVSGALAGCSESAKSVDWYLANAPERALKLAWCNEDMSRAMDADCLNASKAKERAMIAGPGAADTFQFNADPAKRAGSEAPAPAAAAAEDKPAAKPQGKSSADTFQFKPDPKLFPNAAAGSGSR